MDCGTAAQSPAAHAAEYRREVWHRMGIMTTHGGVLHAVFCVGHGMLDISAS